MIHITHTDIDAISCAAIIKELFPDCETIMHNHGEPIDLDSFNEELIITDMSFPIDDMLKLANRCIQVTWVDHHISAISAYEENQNKFPDTFIAYLENGVAACELVWRYFHPNEKLPKAIDLASKYDVWKDENKEEWNEEILPFQYGLQGICNSVETYPIILLEDDDVCDTIINRGNIIIDYINLKNKELCDQFAFEADINNKKIICLNTGIRGSIQLKSVYDNIKYDLAMIFCYDGENYNCSIYNDNKENGVDCSEIAKKLGGGGHYSTSGFRIDSLDKFFNLEF